MSRYALGVDLGTTYSAAAIARGASAEPLPLGTDTAQIPSVVLIREDGEILVGDPAERRASAEPTRAAREFKRRLGDPVPIIIGDATHTVESLMGHLLREIVRRATEQEGEAPGVVVLTHPANYSEYKIGSLREAARLAGLDSSQVILITEPEAAAIAYSRQQRIEPGEIVAIYDFGGGTFDAALVRRTDDRFELIGIPEGMERLGGIDFDQAVMAHVDSCLGGLVSSADKNDPLTRPGQARLRVECRRAKESLSTDSDTSIPVAMPGVQTEVRLTRDEFESMIRPRIAETVRALERAVASAHVTMDQVARVLLVGGTSRMPIVAELVRGATNRPVALDAHPKLTIAVGAALAGAASLPSEAASSSSSSSSTSAAAAEWRPPVRAPEPVAAPSAKPARSSRKVGVKVAAIGGGVGVVAVVAALALGGGSSPKAGPTTTLGQTTVTTTPGATGTTVAPLPGDTSTTVATVAAGRGVTQTVERFAFGESAAGSGIPGPALAAGVSGIVAVTADSAGSVYVATNEATVLRVSGGNVELFASLDPAEGTPGGIVVASDGSVLVSTSAGVRSFLGGGSALLLARDSAGLGATPGPLALDGVGNLFLADNDNHRIIRRGTDGALSLIAGNGASAVPGPQVGDGQPAGNVALGYVASLVVDGGGNLLLADSGALAVRVIAPGGTISTLAGGGSTPLAGSDGVLAADGTLARDIAFGAIDGLAVSPSGTPFVADLSSGAIVRIATDGSIQVVIARNPSVGAVDGVAANNSSISALGALAYRDGVLYFEDAVSLRKIAGL